MRLLSHFFFFHLLSAAFPYLVLLCWCCVFMAYPALLAANQRLCWISRLNGDLFFGLPFAVALDSFSCVLAALIFLFVPWLSVVRGGVRFPGEFGELVLSRLRRTVVV